MTNQGVGASVTRKEDYRLTRGRGRFVADIRFDGQREVAFLRSPVSHARITSIHVPDDIRSHVFTAEDMKDVAPIRADSALPGYKPSAQPPLATGKIRQVGELIAMCVAKTRAEAEDMADRVLVEYDILPAVSDMLKARDADAPQLHEEWGDNIFLETFVETGSEGDMATAAGKAAITVKRRFRTARQCMAPIEGKGVAANWDSRLDQLEVISASQMPHIVRTGLADCLGIDHGRIRVMAPDVGGGFGYKGILSPEEVCIAWLAIHLDQPVRWIEDRREHLIANANCREHAYEITAHADANGRLLALDAEATVDAGAYSVYPFSACLEAAQIASILPGPYDFDAYRCRTWSVASNKPPILPFRGVARTGVCFAMELIMDAIAREAGREPHEVRLDNLIPSDAMPFDNITAKHFDSGDYPECLRRAADAIDVAAIRERQKTVEPDGRRIGLGFSIFCEQAAHGTSVYAGWGIPMVPGFEQAGARLTPDGVLELRVGVHSHGQGLETTLAQVANEVLGIAPENVRVILGDTAVTPYSTGTWGSRCMVMAGGAVATACEEIGQRIARIGAKLLQADESEVRVGDGCVSGPGGSISFEEIGRTWYLKPQDLPDDVEPGGVEVTAGYKPERDSGTFSYAAHAVVVAIDTDIGEIEILDYVVVEDGGVLVNPMIVDGQVHGGAGQGIGTALYEEMQYSHDGQPLASSFADYMLPGATEIPNIRIDHMETPSPYTTFGQKGIGEGGAIGPPAAIANAVNDALHSLGVEINEIPISPKRLLAAIGAARGAAK
jgi:aerobic carbon-monoxide dehydrogenase large subunit